VTERVEYIEHGRSARLSEAGDHIYKVTSGRKAKLASIIATNTSGTAIIHLWDAASGLPTRQSGCPILEIMASSGTFQASEDRLIGIEFSSSIWGRVTDSSLSGIPFIYVGVKEY
jgi:hypothetical protein